MARTPAGVARVSNTALPWSQRATLSARILEGHRLPSAQPGVATRSRSRHGSDESNAEVGPPVGKLVDPEIDPEKEDVR